MTENLVDASCEPCEGGVPTMDEDEAREYLGKVEGWSLVDLDEIPKLRKEFKFDDFVAAIDFVNELAEVAEREGHHPNLEIDYNVVTVTIWTHAIDGLSENDFILAAKLDELVN
jgi:4a-hydroxytetrahydrobiopterin dehydratase